MRELQKNKVIFIIFIKVKLILFYISSKLYLEAFFIFIQRLLATAEYDRYLQSQNSSLGDGVSSFSQSIYSFQSSSVKSSDNDGK